MSVVCSKAQMTTLCSITTYSGVRGRTRQRSRFLGTALVETARGADAWQTSTGVRTSKETALWALDNYVLQ